MKTKNIFILLGSVIVCELAGIIGALFNVTALSGWYLTLEKSTLNPPGWVFGPAWTALFLLMGISLYLVIINRHKLLSPKNKYFRPALIIFSIQWILNIFWSFFFFYLQRPVWAFIEIWLLLIAVIITIYYFSKINRLAAWLLGPYLVWLVFASYLNFAIWQLNI